MGLRDSLLASGQRRSKVVEVNGHKVEVRPPSLGQGLALSETEGAARTEGLVGLIVACTFDPETGKRLFTPEDGPAILEIEVDSNPWPLQLMNAINELIREGQAAAKN